MMFASFGGHSGIVVVLLAAGAAMNQADNNALADAPGDSMRDVAEEIVGGGRRFREEGGERGRSAEEGL